MIRQGFVCHLKNECTLSLLLFTDTLRSKRAKTNTSVELAGMLLPELQLIYQMDRPMSRPVEKNIFFTSFPEGSLISGLLRQWITRTARKGRLKVKKYFFLGRRNKHIRSEGWIKKRFQLVLYLLWNNKDSFLKRKYFI